MKITGLRTTGLSVVNFPIIGVSPADQFIVKAIDGLAPVQLDVAIQATLRQGGVYMGRQAATREIVMRVGLNPNWGTGTTVEQLRSTLYGLLSPGVSDDIIIELMNGVTVVAQTTGYVSKIEAAIFSKDPEVQITIECPESYFSAPTETVLTPMAVDHWQVSNTGTAPSGFLYEMIFNASVPTQALYVLGVGTMPRMRFDYAFLSGDHLQVDTRPGQRAVNLIRGGVTSSIINSMFHDSEWLTMHAGVNDFYSYDQRFTWGQMRFTPQYWGI